MNIIARTVVVAAAAVAVLAPAAGYRGVYRIDDAERVVHVVRIDHRADVCRT